ncbi:AzlC family ABC transporter permease [Desulfonatronovibrio hydrogenovorans]|uniref:AzlC family ABC transporter permease n=1 Tax=Desulfonatronovibrio hydrogenovorans TaxID=53245 RepID=UPI0004905B4A|nr:AzlC family ABC transporter permease [Desulfonatronovibrio hydrogenovorans]
MKTGQDARIIFTRQGISNGFNKCIPLGLGVFAYGLVFGVLAVQAGMTLVQAQLMSLLVFAGASQLMALELWSPHLPILTIVMTTFVVNLRHILMGAAMREWLVRLSPGKTYFSLFFMTDESWALSVREMASGSRDAGFFLGSGLCIYLFWNLATLLGAATAYWIDRYLADPSILGLDFAFTAVFIALLTFFWKGKAQIPVWLVAGLVAGIAFVLLPGKWYIIFGGLAGGLTGACRDA